ncbi:MAG: acetyl-CoA carboxylase biotin carboxyl carrier protein [Rhodospirillales bacterium]|jgi:acetyl-CoA carboxylase biotin carboxyl carrier protein
MALNYRNVAEILKLIDASNLDTVEIDIDGMHLVVRRGAPATSGDAAEENPQDTNAEIELDAEHTTVGAAMTRSDGAIEVCAPMMGTFYRAPSPNDPVYAEVGQVIAAGDALCLIEVMKLFTTLKAEQAGKVIEIPAENGALVNQGDVLFVIEPA